MFFIVNHENSIIAADRDFLDEIGADTVYDAALMVRNGELQLDETVDTLSYHQKHRSFSKTALSTFLGDAFLYQLLEEEEKQQDAPDEEEPLFNLATPKEAVVSEEIESLISEIAEEESLDLEISDTLELQETVDTEHTSEEESILPEIIGTVGAGAALAGLLDEEKEEEETEIEDDSLISLKEVDENIEELVSLKEPDEKEEELISLKGSDDIESIISLKDEEEEPLSLDLETSDSVQEEDRYDTDITLLSDQADQEESSLSTSSQTSEESEERTEAFTQADVTEEEQEEQIPAAPIAGVTINSLEIAELIGVSEEEYKHFLEDFRKESSNLAPHLRSNDLKESREAISTLKEASLLLHLPHITEKLEELSNATSDEKEAIIDSYLTLVAQTSVSHEAPSPSAFFEAEEQSNDTSINNIVLEEKEAPVPEPEEHVSLMSEAEEALPATEIFTLENVQAIPFDFSINEAAEELTLPASLVSEFIVDFIHQAKENIPVLQKAYEEKDIEKIQKTAHMLKGASSNLRIAPMADTLYNLQFNDDLEKVPELISLFTGQLKALSIQMDQE